MSITILRESDSTSVHSSWFFMTCAACPQGSFSRFISLDRNCWNYCCMILSFILSSANTLLMFLVASAVAWLILKSQRKYIHVWHTSIHPYVNIRRIEWEEWTYQSPLLKSFEAEKEVDPLAPTPLLQ